MSATTAEQSSFLVPGLPFTAPELRGMELSGLLVRVAGDLYLPAHRYPPAGRDPETTGIGVRVAAVRRLAEPVLTGPWAAIGLTAAWIHAGGGPPAVLEASVVRYHRRPQHPGAVSLRLEQSALAAGPAAVQASEVVLLHGLPCTTVERTVEDLLRTGAGAPALAAAARLVTRCDPARLRARFEARRKRSGMAGARRALERLLLEGADAEALSGEDPLAGEQAQVSSRCRPEVR